MGVALVFAAIILFVAAYQDLLGYLATNIEQDVKGFFPWLVAIIAIAAIGLIPKAKPVAYALLGLVFLVLMLKKGKGFFDNLKNIKPVAPPSGAQPTSRGAAAAPSIPAAGGAVAVGSASGGSSGAIGAPGSGIAVATGAGAGASGNGPSSGSNVVQFPGVPSFDAASGAF